MDGAAFVEEVNNGPQMNPEDNIFHTIWCEYERIVLQSLVTSFGLDFLVQDQHGGDVDTIHNVREIGNDSQMTYKNSDNSTAYEARGEYKTDAYHSDDRFSHIKRDARTDFDNNGKMIDDAYVPGNTLIPRNNNTIPREHQAQLDHVISAHEIHDDRGRVLAGLDGLSLANDPGNLRFTNANLNLNKSDMTADEYIKWCEDKPEKVFWGGKKGEPLPDDVRDSLKREYNRAKKEYDAKIAKAYYTSPQFAKDTATAAAKRGAEMGLRQALGFIFVEIWMCSKKELQSIPAGSSMEDMLNAVGNGIKKGLESSKSKYKEIFAKVEEGFTAGVLASLTTTLCNIFFTTAKTLVRCIRQVYASVVQAGRVLLFNPDDLLLGDRVKTATVILASGASVLAGTAVSALLAETPVAAIPGIGPVIITFCSSLVSGLLSCTLLIFLDRSKYINDLVDKLNTIPSEVNNYREIADAMEKLAAKLASLDIDQFKQDAESFSSLACDISKCESNDSINELLMNAYENLDINIPWKGDFDSFMGNNSNKLVFG